MQNEMIYDISSLTNLFSANNNLIFRNRGVGLNLVKQNDIGNVATNSFLFSILNKENDVKVTFLNSQPIKQDYVLQVVEKRDNLSDKDIYMYFYYLGHLLGLYTFHLCFDRLGETSHLEENTIKIKTNLSIMLQSFNDYADGLTSLLNELDSTKELVQIMRVRDIFINIIDSLDISSKEKSVYIQPSTLMALNHMALTYGLFGALMLTIDPTKISVVDFVKRCSADVVEQALQTYTNPEEVEKIKTLAYLWYHTNMYYMHGIEYYTTFSENILNLCLHNIGKYAFNSFKENPNGENLLMIENSMIENTVYVTQFVDMNQFASLVNSKHILENETYNPLYFIHTLNNFIILDASNSSDLFNIIHTTSIFNSLNGITAGFQSEDFDFINAKNFIEVMISNSYNEVSPNTIFKLLYIAAYARIVLGLSNGLIDSKIENKQINTSLAQSVIVMAECAVYAMYQEWFNKNTKLYRFENRNFKYDPNYKETVQENLKNEILLTIIDYVRFCIDGTHNSDLNNIIPHLTKLVASMHSDFRSTFPGLDSYKEIYAGMEAGLKTRMEYSALVDYVLNKEYGNLGLMILILYSRDKDMVTELMENNITLNDFFTLLEDNSNIENPMKNYVEKLKCVPEIVGSSSESEVYKRINTNIESIFSSGLSYPFMFYLAYGLNYIYIKHKINKTFAENIDPNVIALDDRAFIVENDERDLLAVENHIRKLFANIDYKKSRSEEKFKKYGFFK